MDFSPANHCANTPRPMCHCLGIPDQVVRDSIAEQDLATVRGVTKACGAGGGCTSCHRHIKRMLHEHAVQKRLANETAPQPVYGFA